MEEMTAELASTILTDSEHSDQESDYIEGSSTTMLTVESTTMIKC